MSFFHIWGLSFCEVVINIQLFQDSASFLSDLKLGRVLLIFKFVHKFLIVGYWNLRFSFTNTGFKHHFLYFISSHFPVGIFTIVFLYFVRIAARLRWRLPLSTWSPFMWNSSYFLILFESMSFSKQSNLFWRRLQSQLLLYSVFYHS